MEFEFDPENQLCIYRISGRVNGVALMQTFASARAHPDWSDQYDFLTLLTNAYLAELPAEALTQLQEDMAKADPVTQGPRRRAAIVCDDELSRAMLTYWEMIAGEHLTTHERVFTTEAEARAWLAEPR
ncbi:hypothetical protein AWH62_10205 [Maricaulis sp. W15]|uniref:STAS/SEC14 domain-containing protein n=1 Tax=Maricaulis sp. W15 TaxID=1772333 RepID=UPI0009491608|nr:STAS/SEC14 domain-containing protein [Maricaulis sp. W15]OLF72211.1 hypothetical protein AWH62_10205 [Maricaulis sp. W15]